MSNAAKKMTTTGHGESTGGRLVTVDGRTLAAARRDACARMRAAASRA